MRAAIPRPVEVEVLTECRRRCALCFGLKADLSEKRGQIAHVDRNAANPKKRNLVFLCLEHHDAYDSRPSQSKGHLPEEVVQYREMLVSAMKLLSENAIPARQEPPKVESSEGARQHDVDVFERGQVIMPGTALRQILERLRSDHSYTRSDGRMLDRWLGAHQHVENEFVSEDLNRGLYEVWRAVNEMRDYLVHHFFVFPPGQNIGEDTQYCLYPDLNDDRGGSGRAGDMKRYEEIGRAHV